MSAEPQAKPSKRPRRAAMAGIGLASLLAGASIGQAIAPAEPSTPAPRISIPVGSSALRAPTARVCWSLPLGFEIRPPEVVVPPEPPPLVYETFDDANLAARGWYDGTALDVPNGALRYHFAAGASLPDSGGATRIQFPPQQGIRLSYRVRYGVGYVGAGNDIGVHELYVLTTESGRYSPLARTALTLYIEAVGGRPVFRMQDGLSIGTALGPVAGCGPVLGQTDSQSSCYGSGATRNNVRWWESPVAALSPGDWHAVEVEIRLNDIAQTNGIIRVTVDRTVVIHVIDAVFRTAAYPNMRLSQLAIGPYVGRSPIDQEFWIDNVVVRELP